MTNLMQRGAAFLIDKLKSVAVAGRPVRYSRGTLQSDEINAVCSQQDYEMVDEQGFVTSVTIYDWTFDVADLLIRGTAVNPQQGDRITETLNGVEIAYLAAPIGTRPVFEWADTSGSMFLVHTKRVS